MRQRISSDEVHRKTECDYSNMDHIYTIKQLIETVRSKLGPYIMPLLITRRIQFRCGRNDLSISGVAIK